MCSGLWQETDGALKVSNSREFHRELLTERWAGFRETGGMVHIPGPVMVGAITTHPWPEMGKGRGYLDPGPKVCAQATYNSYVVFGWRTQSTCGNPTERGWGNKKVSPILQPSSALLPH